MAAAALQPPLGAKHAHRLLERADLALEDLNDVAE